MPFYEDNLQNLFLIDLIFSFSAPLKRVAPVYLGDELVIFFIFFFFTLSIQLPITEIYCSSQNFSILIIQ